MKNQRIAKPLQELFLLGDEYQLSTALLFQGFDTPCLPGVNDAPTYHHK